MIKESENEDDSQSIQNVKPKLNPGDPRMKVRLAFAQGAKKYKAHLIKLQKEKKKNNLSARS